MKAYRLYRFLVIAMVYFLFSSIAHADTQVVSIEAVPATFNPINNESTSITVEATSGVTSLEVRVLTSDHLTLIRSGLTLTESESGIYTADWDGKNNSGAIVDSGRL